MFCPKCKAEYRPGYTVCADCGVPLVDRLPPEPEHEEPVDTTSLPPNTELVHILDTFSPGDMALIKSILDGVGIPYLVEGEHSQYVYHAVPFRLMIPSQQADEAREVLKQLDLSLGQINLADARFDEKEEDQGTDKAIPADIESPKRPIGLSMKWVLAGLFLAAACLVYFYLIA